MKPQHQKQYFAEINPDIMDTNNNNNNNNQ